jgi:stage V sporulation protein S
VKKLLFRRKWSESFPQITLITCYNDLRRSYKYFVSVFNNLLRKQTGGITMDILKVSAKSNPNSVAGALAGVLRERGGAEIQAIGAGALNQAVKSVAIARGFVAPSGMDLVCVPAFTDIQIEGEERTAIKLIVEPR